MGFSGSPFQEGKVNCIGTGKVTYTHTHMCLKSLKQDQNNFFAIPRGSKARSDVVCQLQMSPVRSLLPPTFLLSTLERLQSLRPASTLVYHFFLTRFISSDCFKSMPFWGAPLCVRGVSRHTAEGSSDLLTWFSCGQTSMSGHSLRNPFVGFWGCVTQAHRLLSAGPGVGCRRLSAHMDCGCAGLRPNELLRVGWEGIVFQLSWNRLHMSAPKV